MFRFILPSINLRRSIECWKWNSEYRVYVSNLGHIKNEHKQNVAMKINNRGYCVVFVNNMQVLIHRLVLMTWRPIPNASELTVDHLNHNKRDNSIMNLEWVTREENVRRAQEDLVDEKATCIKPKVPQNDEYHYEALRVMVLSCAQYKKAINWDENADYFVAIPAKGLYFKTCGEIVEYIKSLRPSCKSKKPEELIDGIQSIILSGRRGDVVYNSHWKLGNPKMIQGGK